MSNAVNPSDSAVLELARNTSGRDFCVGDIHGMFTMLEALLDKADFDTGKDRLLSVGDLVDRGPDSLRAVEFLAQPWFHAIRGNHEDMLISCFEDPEDRNTAGMWANNGGQWWHETEAVDRQIIYRAVKPLPLVMEVATPIGQIGIVHADIPPATSWQQFKTDIQAGEQQAIQTALWSRTRAKLHKIAGEVSGIARVYCGHNIVDAPLKTGNVRYIDTGAYMPEGGQLTMVEIGRMIEPSISVAH